MRRLIGLILGAVLPFAAIMVLDYIDYVAMARTTPPRAIYVDPVNGVDTGYHGIAAGEADPDAIDYPFKTIEVALDSLTTDCAGYAVYLRGGVYDLSNQTGTTTPLLDIDIPNNVDSVLVSGYPDETAIIDYAGVTFTTNGWLLDNTGVNGTIIQDITFRNAVSDGNFDLIRVDNTDTILRRLTFQDCGAVASSMNVIDLRGRRNIVSDCTFTQPDTLLTGPNYFMYVRGNGNADIDSLIVRDCTFNASAHSGVPSGVAGGIYATLVDSLVIDGCTFYNAGHNSDDINPDDAIVINDCDRVLIDNCRLTAQLWTTPADKPANDDPMHNRDGIVIVGATCDSIIVRNTSIYQYGHGINALAPENGIFENLWIADTIDDGLVVYTDAAAPNTIRNCVIARSGDDALQLRDAPATVVNVTAVDGYDKTLSLNDGTGGSSITNSIFYNGGRAYDGESVGYAFINEGDASGDSLAVTWDYNLYENEAYESFNFYVYRDNDQKWYPLGETGVGHTWVALRDANAITGDPVFLNPVDWDTETRELGVGDNSYAPAATGPAYLAGNDGETVGALKAWFGLNSDIDKAEQVRATLGGRKSKFRTLTFTSSNRGTAQNIVDGWQIGSVWMKVNNPDSLDVTLWIRRGGTAVSAETDSIIVSNEVFLPVDTDTLRVAVTGRGTDTWVTPQYISVVTYPK